MLKQLFKRGLALGVNSMPFSVSRALCGQEVTVVCDRAVTDEPPAHLTHIIPCRSTSAFRKDLEFLSRRFNPIGLLELLAHVESGRRLPRHPLLLTFDDGLSEIEGQVAPVCRRMG